MNDGTVGPPKDVDPRAGYAVLVVDGSETWVEFVRVVYEAEAVAAAVLAAGLPASLAEGLSTGR